MVLRPPPPGLTLEAIEDGLRQGTEARIEAERAERVGLDMSSVLAKLQEIESRLLSLKREYFPGQ